MGQKWNRSQNLKPSDFTKAPDFEIKIILTMRDETCDFCRGRIDPNKNPKHAKIGPAHGDYFLTGHLDCMEKIGWTMLYFSQNYNVDEEVGVSN